MAITRVRAAETGTKDIPDAFRRFMADTFVALSLICTLSRNDF
jgi:hypothetical protein